MIEEPYHLTLIAFAQLQEHDRLEHAREMDLQFHLGKLVAAAVNEPARVWTLHEEYRSALTAAPSPQLDDALMRRAAALFKRMRVAEARHGAH